MTKIDKVATNSSEVEIMASRSDDSVLLTSRSWLAAFCATSPLLLRVCCQTKR